MRLETPEDVHQLLSFLANSLATEERPDTTRAQALNAVAASLLRAVHVRDLRKQVTQLTADLEQERRLHADLQRELAYAREDLERYRQTLASWQRSVEGAFREVSDALVNLEETGASEADLRERVQAARNALELSQIRYESGYSPYLEVLDAQRTANDAELAFVRNRQARLVFSVDLMKALGGGWQ